MLFMQLLSQPLKIQELDKIAQATFYDLVKAVVDIKQGLIAIDSPLHSDIEAFFIQQKGSHQHDLWGINLHPQQFGTESFIEYDSMINLRPSNNNPSRDVLDPQVRSQIQTIVAKFISK
jgi:hypothetical protein